MKEKLQSIIDKLDDIKYGFVDNNNNIYTSDMDDFNTKFDKLYYLQEPTKLLDSKYGVCWDQVELERCYLDSLNIDNKSYFIIAYNKFQDPTHTFMVANLDKYYWLEHAWEPYKGIHEYETLEDLLKDVKKKFEEELIMDNIKEYEIVIYEYEKPKYNISCIDFMNYCEKGREI